MPMEKKYYGRIMDEVLMGYTHCLVRENSHIKGKPKDSSSWVINYFIILNPHQDTVHTYSFSREAKKILNYVLPDVENTVLSDDLWHIVCEDVDQL